MHKTTREETEMKEVVVTITTLAMVYSVGVITYYFVCPQVGETITMASFVGLAGWGFSFAATHTPSETQENMG